MARIFRDLLTVPPPDVQPETLRRQHRLARFTVRAGRIDVADGKAEVVPLPNRQLFDRLMEADAALVKANERVRQLEAEVARLRAQVKPTV